MMEEEELRRARSQKSEVGRQKTEVRLRSNRGSFRLRFATVNDSTLRAGGQKSEDRNQKSAAEGGKSEAGGEKTERRNRISGSNRMAYIYMDESGDLGFDFQRRRTSKFFVITLLFVKKRCPVEKIVRKVFDSLPKKVRQRHPGPLHCTHEKPTVRLRVRSQKSEV